MRVIRNAEEWAQVCREHEDVVVFGRRVEGEG